MEFHFTPEQETFRSEVRSFLAKNWQGGDGGFGAENDEEFERQRQFEKQLAGRGWLTMAWPKEYGGQGADHMSQLIFREECAWVGAPGSGGQGIGMVGPCLMVHGTEEQKKRFLPPIASAEAYWCQGFSEPGSGSDLASLQTRAVRDGDDYVINGQKIWTSGAQHADWIHILTRTDPEAPKHRGISYFLLDMKTPGITVRPITQMTGHQGFNETFFEDVRVPRENMIGDENRGWYIAATTLDFERSGVAGVIGSLRSLQQAIAYAKSTKVNGKPLFDDPMLRNTLSDLTIGVEVGRWISYRVAWMQSQGLVPNYESSMSKFYAADLGQRIANVRVNLMGLTGQLMKGSPKAVDNGGAPMSYMSSLVGSIAGGTNEVQRNIIATRGLGMPRG